MSTRAKAVAAIALGLLLAFLAGWAVAPGKLRTVEKLRVVEREKRVEVKATETAHAESTEAREVVRWRTHLVTRPDGTRIETREAERDDRRATASADTRREVEVRTVEVEKLVYRDKLVEPVRPAWSLGAYGGLGLDRAQVWGGHIERRVLGPLWVGLQADTRKAAMLTVRVEF